MGYLVREASAILTFLLFAILQNPVVSNKICRVTDDSITNHQNMFRQLVSESKNYMIYIYLQAPEIYEIRDDEFDENRMAEWIWITPDYQHLLKYPLDFDLYTFGLLRKGVKTLHLQIGIENVTACKHSSHTDFLYEYLTKIVNSTDNGIICHRYFKGQEFKLIYFSISHVSIGYDFECFTENEGVTNRKTIEKSHIIYILVVITVFFISFYPTIVSTVINNVEEREQVAVFTKSDYPYTVRQFFHHVLFRGTSNTIVHAHVSAFRLTFLILFFGITFYIMKIIVSSTLCKNCLPTDKTKYPQVFEITTGLSEDFAWPLSLLFLICLLVFNYIVFKSMKHPSQEDHIILIDWTNACFRSSTEENSVTLRILKCIPFKHFVNPSIHVGSMFSQIVLRYRMMGSIYFWSKLFLFSMRNFTKIRSKSTKMIYICSSCVISIFNIIFFLLCTVFPLLNFLIHQSTIIFTCAMSALIPENRQGRFCCLLILEIVWCIISIGSLIQLYVNNFFTYGMLYFLQTFTYSLFVVLPHLYFTQIHAFSIMFVGITYILYFIVSFHKKYRTILVHLLELMDISEIKTDKFEKVVTRFFPLRNAVFGLITKSIFAILILMITVIAFQDVNMFQEKRDIDFNVFVPIIASIFSPWILEKYCLEGIKDILLRKENDIKILLSNESEDIQSNEGSPDQRELCEIWSSCMDDCIERSPDQRELCKSWSCCMDDCIERSPDQREFHKDYVFPSILCNCGCLACVHTDCYKCVREMCSCFTVDCIDESNHCQCCFTLVESNVLSGYERIPESQHSINLDNTDVKTV